MNEPTFPDLQINDATIKPTSRKKLIIAENFLQQVHTQVETELRNVRETLAAEHSHFENDHSEAYPPSLSEVLEHNSNHTSENILEEIDSNLEEMLQKIHDALDQITNQLAEINRVNLAKVNGDVPPMVRQSLASAGMFFASSSSDAARSSSLSSSTSDSTYEDSHDSDAEDAPQEASARCVRR